MTDKAYNKINEMLDVCRSSIKIQHLALSEIAKGAENASIIAQEAIEEIDRLVGVGKARVPVKVTITQCSDNWMWYARNDTNIGQEFVVTRERDDGWFTTIDGLHYFIKRQDAIVTEWNEHNI